ncbi:pyridoxamine 5'-phosphate oxidase family protein [Cryptosporangium japonicum]|uniref:Pyridoxamine 5'-phosphate oxidase N-terminal domain-containing protein n=1 Tax=Cryptosporangium japonicum TaxID=80872 RepID=A0ABP3DQD9_9ACTN
MTNPPQGDTGLLTHPVAEDLLASTELARLAYVAPDGTPRVLPMLFTWDGTDLVMATFGGAAKIRALKASPDVAVTIDTAGPPPHVLQLRGRVAVTDVEGLVPEYVRAHHRYYGPEQGAANIAGLDQPGVRMARIALRPSWVGVLDFETRFPGALAGGTA